MPLNHKESQTMERIFQHPVSYNLEWHEITTLLEQLGTVKVEDNKHLTFTVNGVSKVFHRLHNQDNLEIQQVVDLQHFLEGAGACKNGTGATAPLLRLLVVVTSLETQVFRYEQTDSMPERLHPYDPHGLLHRLTSPRGDEGSPSENLAYYKAVAKTLTGAEEILVMSSGTQSGSTIAHLKDFLEVYHSELAQRIIGTLALSPEALGEAQLREAQLLHEARAFASARHQ